MEQDIEKLMCLMFQHLLEPLAHTRLWVEVVAGLQRRHELQEWNTLLY